MDLLQLAYRLANKVAGIENEEDKKEVELHILRALNHIDYRKDYPRMEVKNDNKL